MAWFLIALAVMLIGGLLSVAIGRCAKSACLVGMASAVLGSGVVMFVSLGVLVSGHTQSLRLAWPLPLGSANMTIDPLSAVFAATIALVTMAAAVYGSQYLRWRHDRRPLLPKKDDAVASPRPLAEDGQRGWAVSPRVARSTRDENHPESRKNLGVSWFFFNLLAASMLLVVAASNGVLFLVSWEMMSLASFFLVTAEDDKESARRAGWTYLVAMHLGTAFLLALFVLLGNGSTSLNFEHFSTAGVPSSSILLLLALIGFGTKAGLVPMHVWLPEAHPAAPSHVSAVMSGVMIKTGIYGLLRTLTFLGPPPPAWGWTLVVVGVASGVLGVLYALSQHSLKRLLAYCSVENVGVIAIGLGVGLLGIAYRHPIMATLGLTGTLLHVINHALFKSLLFLGAGSVLQSTGAGDLDRLGGLLKRMPTTGAAFLVGAAAISGLPPLNGFVSEFLIYFGAVSGLTTRANLLPAWPLMSVLVIGGMALIGGLAAACFTKAFGVVFLGEPRSEEAANAREVGAAMRASVVALAALCLAIGLSAPVWPRAIQPAVATILPPMDPATDVVAVAVGPLTGVVLGSYVLLALIVVASLVRRRLLATRPVERTVTWDCGYANPTPRMQYTASSFTRPVTLLFRLLLQPQDDVVSPTGFFPKLAAIRTSTPDLFQRFIYRPLFAGIVWVASRLRWLQEGRIQIYVLYIALTILVLLIWKLR
ncbi:MAG: proton-conducting transporter membrane subunit [Thermoguttaceae bacterium]